VPEQIDSFCLHAAIEQQVPTQPHRPAVISDEASMTYLELDRLANQVTHTWLTLASVSSLSSPSPLRNLSGPLLQCWQFLKLAPVALH
jgi:non-ribosomal peptide synthetase component F